MFCVGLLFSTIGAIPPSRLLRLESQCLRSIHSAALRRLRPL